MSVKIRLQRFGKRNQAFYHIVAADARAPRDGKFIEKLGIYNPRTSPATIELDTEKTLKWLSNGAQASDTCRAILAYRGVMHRKHLNEGVTKKAITQEEADNRFNAWLEEKNLKITQKSQEALNKGKESVKARLAEEAKVREKIAEKITAKRLAASEAIEADARKLAAEAASAAVVDPAEDATPVDSAVDSAVDAAAEVATPEVAAPEATVAPEPADSKETPPEPKEPKTGDTGDKTE